MISVTTIQSEADVLATLALQQENFRQNVPVNEQISDGFVTVKHYPDLLRRMNEAAPTIIAKNSASEVIGYALTMLPKFAPEVPQLASFFYWIDKLEYKDKPLRDYAYYLMGQVCVKKQYRRQNIFQRMLHMHRELYSNHYQVLITCISNNNNPSLRAHARIGFQTIHTFHDSMSDEAWDIVLWDWQK